MQQLTDVFSPAAVMADCCFAETLIVSCCRGQHRETHNLTVSVEIKSVSGF